MTNQRLGVHATQFFFAHRERHNRHVCGFQASVTEFFVERYVRVAINGRDHSSFATGCKFLDVCNDSLIVRVTKRCVFFVDVAFFHALRNQEGAQDFVGGAWVHIVSAKQDKTFGATAVCAHQVFNSGDGLLVRCSTGVKHVFLKFFALVLHGVEQQTVQLFKHGQD